MIIDLHHFCSQLLNYEVPAVEETWELAGLTYNMKTLIKQPYINLWRHSSVFIIRHRCRLKVSLITLPCLSCRLNWWRYQRPRDARRYPGWRPRAPRCGGSRSVTWSRYPSKPIHQTRGVELVLLECILNEMAFVIIYTYLDLIYIFLCRWG